MSFALNPTWCIFLHENVEINISAPCSLSVLCSFTPSAVNFILKIYFKLTCSKCFAVQAAQSGSILTLIKMKPKMQRECRGLGACLDASLIHAKSSLICSSVLRLQQRIHWLAAKLGCVGTLTGVPLLVSEDFKTAWAACLILSTLTSVPGSEVTPSLKWETKCLRPKMWPRSNNCWSYSSYSHPRQN